MLFRSWPGRSAEIIVADGGAERSQSVRKGLEALASRATPDDWVLVHDAARPCLSAHDLQQLLGCLGTHRVGGILATPAADTLKRASTESRSAGSPTTGTAAPTPGGSTSAAPEIDQTVDRAGLWRALTPQMFRYKMLSDALDRALASGRLPTDEAQALEWTGEHPVLVQGSAANIKITSADDLVLAAALLNARESQARSQEFLMRIGSGIDVHAFGPGDFVMLGGVRIPHSRGVVAHSDGDVVLHALCDALLGAAGLGDIGQHFKDTDPRWKGADSKGFVRHIIEMLRARKLRVGNADVTVLSEAPKVGPHRDEIRRQIAGLLEVSAELVNVKATTTEKLGFLGRSEGIAAQAVVLLLEA